MLTTDPIYYKPLLPVITIKTTGNPASNLYRYDSFAGTVTDGPNTVIPVYCSVILSQNTHGEFTIQFDDVNHTLESTVTVGSRVIIHAGKQSSSLTRLISGLVRKKGYTRGSNNRVLYTISGSSTGIRLNELLTYAVSEAAKLGDNVTPDPSDATRKADTLLATNLAPLTADGIVSIANLAANSDVETFVASLAIEFGELQDVVNYISAQSGGELIVDTTDLAQFRHEIKNTLFGRGFTLKNSCEGMANDDADDTMYMTTKNWTYEDDFYKSSNYGNRNTAILAAQPRPSTFEDMGFTAASAFQTISSTRESAVRFKPTHSRFIAGDIYLVLSYYSQTSTTEQPTGIMARVCRESGGLPMNTNGIVANLGFFPDQWPDPLEVGVPTFLDRFKLTNDYFMVNETGTTPKQEFWLDTTKYYWLILSNIAVSALLDHRIAWGLNSQASGNTYAATHTSGFSTVANGGTGWTIANAGLGCFALGQYRAVAFEMWDPKGMQAVSSGLAGGQPIEAMVPNPAVEIRAKESMYRYLSTQMYGMARPRSNYSFSNVLAPNIPPVPGDPIIIDDSVLGFSEPGNQVVITNCGDMTYTWGNMGSGSYDAPTKLSIQAVAVHPRYR